MKKSEGLRLADAYLKGLGLEGVAVPSAQTGCAGDRAESPASSSGDSAREVVRPVCAGCGGQPHGASTSILHPELRSLCSKCSEAETVMCQVAHRRAIDKYGPDALFKLGLERFRKEFGS